MYHVFEKQVVCPNDDKNETGKTVEGVNMDAMSFGKCFNDILTKIEEEHPQPELFYGGFKSGIIGFLHPNFAHNAVKSIAKTIPREVANRIEIGSYFPADGDEKRKMIINCRKAASFFNALAETIKQLYETDCAYKSEE